MPDMLRRTYCFSTLYASNFISFGHSPRIYSASLLRLVPPSYPACQEPACRLNAGYAASREILRRRDATYCAALLPAQPISLTASLPITAYAVPHFAATKISKPTMLRTG